MAHAYYIEAEKEQGIARALHEIEETLGLTERDPDVLVFRYGLLSIDEARELTHVAAQTAVGSAKAIIIAADRFFYEAQNALLKLFEEPPSNTHLFVVVPSEDVLLATLRSRMMSLPSGSEEQQTGMKNITIYGSASHRPIVEEFLRAGKVGREKLVEGLLREANADNQDKKRHAREKARALAAGLLSAGYEAYTKEPSEDLKLFLEDLSAFVPILYERSAPLRQILEHLLFVIPKSLLR